MPDGPRSLRAGGRSASVALALCVVLGLLVRGAHFVALSRSALPGIQLASVDLDTASHWEWSARILQGDLLGRETYHQYTEWMARMAPIETWFRWWGGPEVFCREPLYVYLLALIRAVLRIFGGGDSPLAALGLQLAIGSLQPIVLFFLGRRLLDERAGLLAAFLGAVYGPFVFFEGSFLRDWLPPILEPLLLLALLRAQDRGRPGGWVLAGLLFAGCTLVRSVSILFLPIGLAWILWNGGRGRSGSRRSAAFLLLGCAIGLAPLVTRNLRVGAPAFAISNRGPEALIESNTVDVIPIGMHMPPSMPEILERAQGSVTRTAVEIGKRSAGSWGRLLRIQWIKLWGIFDPTEHSDNLDYEYGCSISPVLRYAPRFAIVGLLGVAGCILSWRSAGARALALLYALTWLPGALVLLVVGRYRLGLTAVLIAFAAVYLTTCWDRARSRAKGGLLAALAILPVLFLTHVALQPKELRDSRYHVPDRRSEYWLATNWFVNEGRYEEAVGEALRYRERVADRPERRADVATLESQARTRWGHALIVAGRRRDADLQASVAKELLGSFVHDATSSFLLGRLLFELDDLEGARSWLERSLQEDAWSPSASLAHDLLVKTRKRSESRSDR